MKRLSSEFYELVRNACLKSFWYKDSLKHFLRCNGVSKSFLASWFPGESKAQFLSRLFSELEGSCKANVQQAVLSMAQELSEKTKFADWEKQPDGEVKILEAKTSCLLLRKEFQSVAKLLDEAKTAERRRNEERARATEEQYWNEQFNVFSDRLKEIFSRAGEQKAGYDLETWIYDFAVFNDIDAKRPYKDANGRQIDGTLTVDGTTILIEAKCTKEPTSCTDVDIFLSKVNRKAENTRGLILSLSGFDKGAIESASRDKTPIVLMDGGHLFSHVFTRRYSFADVIRRMLQYASQSGDAYLSPSEF